MFKKLLASIVSAAVLVAGPGHLTLDAAAQTIGRGAAANISVIPTIGTGLNNPVLGDSSFMMPSVMPGALTAPSLLAAPNIDAPVPAALTLVATPSRIPANAAMPATVPGSPLAVIASRDAKVGLTEKDAALDTLFENAIVTGHEAIEVLGQSAVPAETGLDRSVPVGAVNPSSINGWQLNRRGPEQQGKTLDARNYYLLWTGAVASALEVPGRSTVSTAKATAASKRSAPELSKRLKTAWTKIADYHEKEGVEKTLLSNKELLDLTAQLHYIIGLPDSDIPAELLGHIEGVCSAIRYFLNERQNPNESAVKAVREAAEKLRAKVVAIPS